MSEALTVVNNAAEHRFEARLGDEVAFAEYRVQDGQIVLPHTVVPDAFSGKGVGSQLARAALGFAREQRLEVVPTCPFIAGYITKHPEWHDLVAPSFRERLGLSN